MIAVSATTSPPSPVPSIAAYNIRFLTLSDSSEQRAQHQRKLASVQHLAKQYVMTAVLETHVTGAEAELFFCRNVEGTRRFFVHGMAVIVQEAWARLDAHAEATQIQQVRRATLWAKEHVCREDVVIFAGDRNFVRTDSERWTCSSSSWRTSLRVNAAWDDWLHSIGDAYEVPQPKFTWRRVNADQSEHATWISEFIDVVGSNRKFYSPGALRSSARRGDDLPHPRASDHWPVGLRWSGVKTRRKPQDSSDDIVQRPIPAWLLGNLEF